MVGLQRTSLRGIVVQGYRNYRLYLRDELDRRMKSDASVSLRSFAKQLAISRTSLSDILRGKANLSPKRAATVAARLGMSRQESSYFVDLVSSDNSSKELADIAKSRIDYAQPPSLMTIVESDSFQTVSDWQHFAILELMETKDFQHDARWIARKLKLSPLVVSNSLARLVRVGMIKESKRGFVKTNKNITTERDVPSSAVRKHNLQQLDMAKTAVETQAVASRNFTTMTMAIDPSRLDAAKQMVEDFVDQLTSFLEAGERSAVYSFNTQLFRLDHHEGDRT